MSLCVCGSRRVEIVRRREQDSPDDVAARTTQRVSYALTAAGVFAIVADVFVDGYEPPVWIGPMLLAVAGGVFAKGARDAVQAVTRKAQPREDDE